MPDDQALNLAARLVTIGLTRARMLATNDLESVILDITDSLRDLFSSPCETSGASQLENARSIALLLVAKLTATRRIDTYRYIGQERWLGRISEAVGIVEIELFNAQD